MPCKGPTPFLSLLCFCLSPAICLAQTSGNPLASGDPDSLLEMAAYRGDLDAVKHLIEQGAHVNAVTGLAFGATPLDSAASQGHLNVVQFLIAHGADPNIRIGLSCSALCSAVSAGHLDVVEYLLDHGADPKSRSFSGDTAFTFAASRDDPDFVRVFLDHGVTVETTDGKQQTALMVAASGNHLRIAEFLLNRGAQVDVTGLGGKTALMLAAAGGGLEVVRLLLDRGADANVGDNDLRTALDYATKKGSASVHQLLLGRTNSRTVLQEAVARLQERTYDDHLRERIIDLALQLDPHPSLPDDAKTHFNLGLEAMDSPESWKWSTAEREFQQAADIAPWFALAYYKGAITSAKIARHLEQEGIDGPLEYGFAARAMKFYLLASPDASDLQQALAFQQELQSKSKTNDH